MKAWQKWAIVGGITGGIFGFIFDLFMPRFLTLKMALIGAIVGYVIKKPIKTWRKGAIIGGVSGTLVYVIQNGHILPYLTFSITMVSIGTVIGYMLGKNHEKEKIEERKLKMEVWKKGAIIGGLWGSILGNSVYYLVGMFYWERTPPRILEDFLSLIVYLPTKIFSKILYGYYGVYKAPIYVILYFGSNFVGWIIIGAIVGYLYGRRMEGKF